MGTTKKFLFWLPLGFGVKQKGNFLDQARFIVHPNVRV